MKYVKAFGLFWYDFVIGDDWRVAAGCVVALGLTALLAHETDVAAWWVMPVAVALLLARSVFRAAHDATPSGH